jgi:hypothetical protein
VLVRTVSHGIARRLRPAFLAAATAVTVGGLALAPAAPALGQQRYVLELKPRVGDTLRMELEEQREHTGTASYGGGDSSRTMTTRLRVISRAIVQAKLLSAVTVLAIIDSVSLSTTDRHAPTTPTGQRMLFRLAPDGTMRVLDEETGANRGISEAVALMPAALPAQPVAVGETWTRAIPMVVARSGDDEGTVRAWFRLDSVSRDARLAYISMRGEMRRDSIPAGPPRGTRMQLDGTVTGSLLLDRRRGWLTESRFWVVLHTTMLPVTAGAPPVRFLTRITQRMRTLDRK